MTDFLDEFLKNQLLDIGDDDGRLANLQAASATVCDEIKADLWQLARYTRVGLDKDIEPDEPVLDEIEEAIKAHWKLIRNKHTERPVSIIRAVLWEAVRNAVDEDANAIIVALTVKAESEGTNLGPEADACQRFLSQITMRVERLAEEEWTGQPKLATGKEEKKASIINTALLTEKLLAACGPDGPDGAIKGANPHWPTASAPWSAEFSQQAAKGIADVVGRHVKATQTTLDDVAQELATEIQNAGLAVSRKTDLLWWSRSRFCITLGQGFGELPTLTLPFFLACDIQLLAPGLCPQSVDHFLAHVVHSATLKSEKTTLRNFFESLVTGDFRSTVAENVLDVPTVTGRCGILSAVKRALVEPTAIDDIIAQLAIGSTEITLPTLAKRLFWELKAKSIAASVELGEADE